MKKLHIIFRYISILVACLTLSACLGGTIAQQIARSIATSIADKSMARALDVDEDQPYSNRKPNDENVYSKQAANLQISAPQTSIMQPFKPANATKPEQASKDDNLRKYNLAKQSLQNYQPVPFKLAMANTAFNEIKPTDINSIDAKPIAEPLPQDATVIENKVAVVQSSQLVRVELFNLLIGEEKNAVYEQARLIGATSLPQKREWALWRVATGLIQDNYLQIGNNSKKKPITFLIPPQFGKLPSGAITMVELAGPGELNIVRYAAQ